MQFDIFPSRVRQEPVLNIVPAPNNGWVRAARPTCADPPAPARVIPAAEQKESAPLLGADAVTKGFLDRAEARSRTVTTVLVVTLIAIAVTFGILGFIMLKVNSTIDETKTTLRPPLETMLNISVSAADDVSHTLGNIVGMTDGTRSITDYSAAEVIAMVNSTRNIVTRMENLLTHPSVNIDLVPRLG
jgi:archaellum component FlaF (FlaF/FlaG flagellin family)